MTISRLCHLPNTDIALKSPKYLNTFAKMLTQNEVFPCWLPTGKGCDLVQATCELSACHSAAFIAPLIRCDIFSL